MDRNKSAIKYNEQITVTELRIIGSDGEALGVMSNEAAQNMASVANLDLVLIVPDAMPPVAKIISLNKYNYELKKRQKFQEKSARANAVEIKEVKFRPGIGIHDLQIKMRKAQKFIDNGSKVKITIQMKGRENAKAHDVLTFFVEAISNGLANWKYEQPLKLNGNRITGLIQKND
ncbi:translation initiation factor IF-3 [bacterium]|jgi:translation initiation factor IF-3|nr:translation initiation factor IF-3 [bacterium]